MKSRKLGQTESVYMCSFTDYFDFLSFQQWKSDAVQATHHQGDIRYGTTADIQCSCIIGHNNIFELTSNEILDFSKLSATQSISGTFEDENFEKLRI